MSLYFCLKAMTERTIFCEDLTFLAQRDGQCRAFASLTATAQDREVLVSAHIRPRAEIYADTYHADACFASDYPLHRVNHSRGNTCVKGYLSTRWKVSGLSQASLLRDPSSSWAFKPMQRYINSVLCRINRRSKAERPMTAWDRISDLFGQGLTARTTDKQLVKGEA